MEARNGRNFGPGTCNPNNPTPGYYQSISQSNHTANPSGLHRGNTSQRASLSLPPHRNGGLFMPLHYYMKREDPCPCSCFSNQQKIGIRNRAREIPPSISNKRTNQPIMILPVVYLCIEIPLVLLLGLCRAVTPDGPTRMGYRNNAVCPRHRDDPCPTSVQCAAIPWSRKDCTPTERVKKRRNGGQCAISTVLLAPDAS